jgi:hypothetical protein
MTDAGKRLLEELILWTNGEQPEAYIAAIEAEAVAAERARIRAAVEEFVRPFIDRAAVLAIIEGADDD